MPINTRERRVHSLLGQEFLSLEASFRTLAEAVAVGIFVGRGKRLHYVNPFAETLTGYTREELLFMSFWDLVHPESTELVLNRTHVREGNIVVRARHEVRILTKGHVERWLDIRTGIIEFGGALSSLISAFDITERKDVEQQLQLLAATDPLTGLGNYRRFIEALDAEIRRSGRTGRSFALLVLDLDHLKKINDRYGHSTGSQALCRLAEVLRHNCRAIDTAARYGGDEFAVILPETTAEAVRLVVLRIHKQLAKDNLEPPLSVSVGMAVYPKDGETVEAIFRTADRELYEMKRREGKARAASV